MNQSMTESSFSDRTHALQADQWPAISALADELAQREINDVDAFETWLLDRSEFDAACAEGRATLYIEMTRHTDDASAASAWTRYLEDVQPNLQRASFELDQRQHALAKSFPLAPDRYGVLNRDTAVDVELFKEENVPLETELGKLDQRYEAIMGAMTVEFDGKERTIPEMATYLERPDRELRERAWRATASRRLADKDAINSIFDEMVQLRASVARNAGFANFRDYMFRRRRRFDYSPADCEAYHNACREEVVPLLRSLDDDRAKELGVSPLRPWDLAVDVKGRAPLKPFENAADLVSKTERIFERMGNGLGEMFASLKSGDALDLESRKGKAPGGYQYMRDLSRKPFIFMNAAGLHGDVRTLIHEAGHAFHSMLCVDEPLVHYRHSPIEFAEVASMSMELLTMDYWDEFYSNEDDLRRAKREQFEGIVTILPWVATIDAFQHWIYLNPDHTQSDRTHAWLRISGDFGHDVNWEGLESTRESMWQRQGHLFGVPFYYIEYGIAQLGALQLWLIAREQGLERAIEAYRAALSLGGAKPLPELFEAAGLTFDFGPATIRQLMGAVRDELKALPL